MIIRQLDIENFRGIIPAAWRERLAWTNLITRKVDRMVAG